MARKNYWIYGKKYISHNYMILKAIEPDIVVSSITAIASDGGEIEMIANPVKIGSSSAVRYGTIVSDRIRITIDHHLSDVLKLEELINVRLGLDNYKTSSKYISDKSQINFNKNLTIVYDIENLLDAFIKTELHLSVIDNYDNIIYSEIVPVSINDDGWMVERAIGVTEIELPYNPVEDSLYILIEGSRIDKFKIVDRKVILDIPMGYECLIIYKPKFTEQGSLYELSNNVSLTPSYGLILRDNYCNKINFSLIVDIYNPDITSTNHTPIIKSLGIMTSDK